jgi:hypothetical protein
VMGNVTEVCPAGMVTMSGTVRMPQVDSRYPVSATSGAPVSVTDWCSPGSQKPRY